MTSHTTPAAAPSLSELAAAAKSDRNRAVDAYRALAMGAVAAGHWMAIAIGRGDEGQLTTGNALSFQPSLGWVTWLFQVMPLFFVVGGFSSAMSLDAHRARDGRDQDWVVARLRRMVAPTMVLATTWLGLLIIGGSVDAVAGTGITGLLAGLWSGGVAFLQLLSLVIITPVVAFYLLRDWDRIVEHLDSLLPVAAAPTIREQLRKIDDTISAFVRGQAIVCLILGAYYAVALTLIGLPFGLLVGIGAGLISFIPYIGAAAGLIVGLVIAYTHFDQWTPIIGVAAVFLAGQTVESYVLTPRLVGDRVGLHPVWIMFALLAGGALFGFTGVLLAVPAAAVIGVLLRFAIARYRDSDLYQGGGP